MKLRFKTDLPEYKAKLEKYLYEKKTLANKHIAENKRDGLSWEYYQGMSYAFYEVLRDIEKL